MLLYDNIKTLRALHGHTQKKIAGILEVDPTYYSRIEHGGVDIHVSLLIKLSEVYKVTVQNLIYSDLSDDAIHNIEKQS